MHALTYITEIQKFIACLGLHMVYGHYEMNWRTHSLLKHILQQAMRAGYCAITKHHGAIV